ncbi:MAG: HNH endonuclease signature motif containing protein [Rhodospirillaceae bacterium]|nr:HNH endonuclease signature motif containing protein [Rhodospirillaceae bacterium]
MSTKRERKEIYSTPRWVALRQQAFERDGHICVNCAKDGRTTGAVLVHHIKPIRQGGDPWALKNLRSLCRSCHEAEHAEPVSPALLGWRQLVSELMPKEGDTANA